MTKMIDDNDALKSAQGARLLQEKVKELNELVGELSVMGCDVIFLTEGTMFTPVNRRLLVSVSLSLVQTSATAVGVPSIESMEDS